MIKIKYDKELWEKYGNTFLEYSCLAKEDETKNLDFNSFFVKKFEIFENKIIDENKREIKIVFSYPFLLSEKNIINFFNSFKINGEIIDMKSIGSVGDVYNNTKDFIFIVTLSIEKKELFHINTLIRKYDLFQKNQNIWLSQIPEPKENICLYWFWGKIDENDKTDKMRIILIKKETDKKRINYKYYLSNNIFKEDISNFNGIWCKINIPDIPYLDIVEEAQFNFYE